MPNALNNLDKIKTGLFFLPVLVKHESFSSFPHHIKEVVNIWMEVITGAFDDTWTYELGVEKVRQTIYHLRATIEDILSKHPTHSAFSVFEVGQHIGADLPYKLPKESKPVVEAIVEAIVPSLDYYISSHEGIDTLLGKYKSDWGSLLYEFFDGLMQAKGAKPFYIYEDNAEYDAIMAQLMRAGCFDEIMSYAMRSYAMRAAMKMQQMNHVQSYEADTNLCSETESHALPVEIEEPPTKQASSPHAELLLQMEMRIKNQRKKGLTGINLADINYAAEYFKQMNTKKDETD